MGSVKKVRVVHVINSFEFGGAEAMLCNLLLRTDRDHFEPSVASLTDDLALAAPVLAAGIPIATMGMKRGIPDPRGLIRLASHLRSVRPDVVQTWMDHSNLIGGLAAKMGTRARVVWGIHHSEHIREHTKGTTLATLAACEKLSRRLPECIVCCSQHSKKLYAKSGFAAERLAVIPNGFDTALFRPNEDARRSIREELGISASTPLIGLIGRYDPMKDHQTFIAAAAELHKLQPEAHFLLCGSNVDTCNSKLMNVIHTSGLGGVAHLLGQRRDMPRIHAALDITVSSSISEAFPLAIGEAMSSAVPCVATNVGDSAIMIGDTGRIVEPRNPKALAHACAELLAMNVSQRQDLGAAARRRVCELFDLTAVTQRYEALYHELVSPNYVPPEREEIAEIAEPCAKCLSIPATLGEVNGNGHPIRVLIVVEATCGGTGRHVFDLAEGLIARGVEVHMIYSTRRMDSFFRQRLTECPKLRHTAVSMRRSLHPSDLAAVWTVRRYMRKHGPFDVVHGHSSKGGGVARLSALGKRASAFYTLHGFQPMDASLPRVKRLFFLLIELALSLRTKRIIAVSPEESRAAKRGGLGRSRVTTVPNGIGKMDLTSRAEARRMLGLPQDAIVFGFVGRLVEAKAPEVLVRAFAATRKVVPQARLVMVGSGDLLDPMKELAARLGVADAIHWLGEFDARKVLNGFDAFVLSSRKEGLPYVVLEAIAAGLPVVATRSSGVELLVRPGVNGSVVRTGDVTAFATAMIEIASDRPRAARLGEASLGIAAEFSLDAMIERTLRAYRSGIHRPSATPTVAGSNGHAKLAAPSAQKNRMRGDPAIALHAEPEDLGVEAQLS